MENERENTHTALENKNELSVCHRFKMPETLLNCWNIRRK